LLAQAAQEILGRLVLWECAEREKGMVSQTGDTHKVDWQQLLQMDGKAAAAIVGSALFLIALLGVLPAWLRGQERADFAAAAVQTAPGRVTVCQISPVSQGGGGLYNGVNVAFAGRQAYYALPPTSQWKPVYQQPVTVTYRVGTRTGLLRVDTVTPR